MRPGARKRLFVSLAAVVLIVGGGIGIAAKINSDQEADAARKEATAEVAAHQAEVDAQAAQASQDAAAQQTREAMVPDIEAAITKMAKKDVNDGILDGPIYETQCDPVGGGSVGDLTVQTTKFECLVVNKKNSDGSSEGYKAHATMNWDSGEYQYGLGAG